MYKMSRFLLPQIIVFQGNNNNKRLTMWESFYLLAVKILKEKNGENS